MDRLPKRITDNDLQKRAKETRVLALNVRAILGWTRMDCRLRGKARLELIEQCPHRADRQTLLRVPGAWPHGADRARLDAGEGRYSGGPESPP